MINCVWHQKVPIILYNIFLNFSHLNIFRVNPVTGCYEEVRADPMAGMTDEQKEEEAMKLVQHLDKLQRYTKITAYMGGGGGE